MKTLLSICLLALSLFIGCAHAAPPPGAKLTGEVLETKDVDSYTYLRLKTSEGETWAAVPKAEFKKGAKVTLENTMTMTQFESKSLKKTFASIIFGNVVGAGPAGAGARPMASAEPAGAPIKVSKASGANAHTVAEVVAQAVRLKDQSVRVHAKVVKYSEGIMGKNWIHLRDGSGSATDGSNDILATSTAQTRLGDVLTVIGVVRLNKDFGSGYSYKVIIEDATLQP